MTSSFSTNIGRRHVLLGLAAGAATGFARADNPYPDHPIHVILPQPAGGTGDVVTRLVTQRLGVRLNQTIVVDNRPGAGGTLGARIAAKAPADGYTLVLSSPGFATFSSMYANPGVVPATDLVAVGMMGSLPIACIVRSDSRFASIHDFIAFAKANPGKTTFGSAGIGSLSHLMGAWFTSAAGIEVTHVPYAGTAPALNGLLGGQTDLLFDSMAGAELIKAGKLRALATTTEKRSPLLPGTPTMIESGVPIHGSVWLGLMAPTGTPKPILERLNKELAAVLQEPDLRKQLEARLVTADTMTIPEYDKFFASETANLSKLVRDNGIKAE